MLNSTERNLFLTEAIRIGDHILSRAIWEGGQVYWKTLHEHNDDVIESEALPLYDGNAGICLFLIQLWSTSGKKQYKEVAEAGANRLFETCCNDFNRVGFYTGMGGVIYTFVRLYELTGNAQQLQRAETLANVLSNFFNESHEKENNELVNGVSGSLLGLLHLYTHTNNQALVMLIRRLTVHVLTNLHGQKKGVSWDMSHNQVRGLCGMAHGVSGISAVLMECSRVFSDTVFEEVAMAGFAYEDAFFSPTYHNWPDYRIGVYSEQHLAYYKNAYLEGNIDSFYTHYNTNAWCHGAAGIGIARIRAYQVTGNQRYLKNFRQCVKTVYEVYNQLDDNTTMTHCHGIGSYASLLLFGYGVLKEASFYKMAVKMATKGLKAAHVQEKYLSGFEGLNVEDWSLLNGNAGIGYFYLQLLDPLDTPSLLFPAIPQQYENSSKQTLAVDISNSLYERYFPHTVAQIKKVVGLLPTLPARMENLYADLGNLLQSQVDNLPSESEGLVKMAFRFEKKINLLQRQSTSSLYLYIRDIVATDKDAANLLKTQLNNKLLVLCLNKPYTQIYSSYYNYVLQTKSKTKLYYVLQKKYNNTVVVHPINEFVHFVLLAFSKPLGLEAGIQHILEKVNDSSDTFVTFIRQQIAELLFSGILTVVSTKS